MKFSSAQQKVVHLLPHLANKVRHLRRLVGDSEHAQTYYPEAERKSKLHISRELLVWLLRHREINSFYYFYGLDKKHGVRSEDFLSYNEFRSIRDRHNRKQSISGSYTYLCLLRDKFVFSQIVSSLSFPTPRNLALCTRDSITWLDRNETMSWETLLDDQQMELDVFCKHVGGVGGTAVFPLHVTRGTLRVHDQETTVDQVKAMLNGMYLLQEPIRQHPAMSMLHPQSINAIRLVTFNNGGDVQPFWAALKVGTGGRRVDNVGRGGVGVRINMASGRLEGEAMYLPGYGGRIARHPDTNVCFDGFEIPCFHEAVELALKLHRFLYGIHSIGWDIAITETGPTFIEGNDDWAGHFAMAFVPNFKQRFLEMYKPVHRAG